MNKKEAAMLLTLIKLSYPQAYRDYDDSWKKATIHMWESSFRDVPYAIIEQGFNHYRMNHVFPPTVAEMVEELRHIWFEASESERICRGLGNQRMAEHYSTIMAYTKRFTALDVDGLNLGGLVGRIGGCENAGRPGNRLADADGLSFLDAGRG